MLSPFSFTKMRPWHSMHPPPHSIHLCAYANTLGSFDHLNNWRIIGQGLLVLLIFPPHNSQIPSDLPSHEEKRLIRNRLSDEILLIMKIIAVISCRLNHQLSVTVVSFEVSFSGWRLVPSNMRSHCRI